jgi:Tol biopolymer transport system component
LTSNGASDFDPTWSPNGKFIAFLSTRNGGVDLFVMRKDGTRVRPLTNSRAREVDPTWKP